MGNRVSALLESEFKSVATLAATAHKGSDQSALLLTDVVIDFSLPQAMIPLAKLAMTHPGKLPAFVVGSTGWTADERQVLEILAQRTPVLLASNFSTGVLALVEILRQAAPLLLKLGYTPVLVEAHHRHKKDSPSGTALTLQRVISPAHPESVQTHAIRAGEVIGDHEITFYSAGDEIKIGHFAQDRSIFARGAIQAALWLSQQATQGKVLGLDAYFDHLKGEL
jgi:4-hydroxy-tetrahydrodipicolinate reductase